MKNLLLLVLAAFLKAAVAFAQPCTPLGDQSSYGSNDTWIGYVYDGTGFNSYMGYINEGSAGNPNFNENFGGNNVSLATNGCATQTETFSVRFKLLKNFSAGTYSFTVGGDDGYRLSLDGGSTWVIDRWWDQGYNTSFYTVALNGSVNLVLEYYENAGGNQVSFDVAAACLGSGDPAIYGTGDVWRGYVYDGTSFNIYRGYTTEGTPGDCRFDESFGGSNVNYATSDCPVQTETFSVRYRLSRFFPADTYVFTVGGDDGYRLSLDGGTTWIIDRWTDQSYNTQTVNVALNGTYNLVLEYYENGGDNRITFDYTSSLLPVVLRYFSGSRKANTVALRWATTQEKHVDHFDIERSSNGYSFTAIGRQNALAGLQNDYQFIDPDPGHGTPYYRLKMQDQDGRFRYSAVIRVVSSLQLESRLFPTVLDQRRVLYLQSAEGGRAQELRIFDLMGRERLHKYLPGAAAGSVISVDLSGMKAGPGWYLVQWQTGKDGEKLTRKIRLL